MAQAVATDAMSKAVAFMYDRGYATSRARAKHLVQHVSADTVTELARQARFGHRGRVADMSPAACLDLIGACGRVRSCEEWHD